MELRLGARQSDLARLQAYQVGQELQKRNPGIKIQYQFKKSLGDINLKDPLWKMPEKGVFTQDFRQGLLEGQCDLVVHSWKDLPIEQEAGTKIVATLPRADMRDLLLFKKDYLSKVKESGELKVFSSSPRRIYNLTPFFMNYFPATLNSVEFLNVRGNILTRMEKTIADSQVDGIIVAKAAIDRLLTVVGDEFKEGKNRLQQIIDQCFWQVLPLSANPTAAAQGALAIEVAEKRDDLIKLMASVNCQKTWDAVSRERALLKKYGGGCHQKIGVSVLPRDYGSITFLKGETESGEILSDLDLNIPEIKLLAPLSQAPQYFRREKQPWILPENKNAHYVSRSQAFPEDFCPAQNDIVWTSGLKSWRSLAERGIWVHGSSESLGESEAMGLDSLRPNLNWVKWSHTQAPENTEKTLIASYRLIVQDSASQLDSFQEFFWMSGTQFIQAVKISPEILHKKHFCGPGHTFTKICEVLKESNVDNQPTVLPGYRYWLQLLKDNS